MDGETIDTLSLPAYTPTTDTTALTNTDEDNWCICYCDDISCKGCLTVLFRFKVVLAVLSITAFASISTGVALGVSKIPAHSYLTVSLLFAGLGLLLFLIVICIWRCTPTGHEPCHLLFTLGDYSARPQSQRSNSSRRFAQWAGGWIYPEFRYHTPPPSYLLSMEEARQNNIPQSPPPLYKFEQNKTHCGKSRKLRGPNSPPPYSRRPMELSVISNHTNSEQDCYVNSSYEEDPFENTVYDDSTLCTQENNNLDNADADNPADLKPENVVVSEPSQIRPIPVHIEGLVSQIGEVTYL